MSFARRVQAWDRAGGSPDRQVAIAPPAKRAGGSYDESGRQAVRKLLAACGGGHHGHDVLDFGCGDGRVAKHLVPLFGSVTGADASREMLAALVRRCPEVRPLLWDGRGAPELWGDGWPDGGQWDVVCSFLTLTHYPFADGAKMLAGMAAATKPGGLVAVQVPLYERGRDPRTWTSVGTWTGAQMGAAAVGAGLGVVSMAVSPGRYRPRRPGRFHGSLHLLEKPTWRT